MKRFCDDLKEHVTRITNYAIKPMDPRLKMKENHMKSNSYVIYAMKKNSERKIPAVVKK